jgi:DNA-binding MarR family transcriptional regulator
MRSTDAIENEDCRCCGLTKSQALALLALESGRCVAMRDLAESLGVSASTATRILDNLVRDGFVFRGVHPSDRRSVCAGATPKGEIKIRELSACYETFWTNAFGRIPKERRTETLRVLESLTLCVEDTRKASCGGTSGKTGRAGGRKTHERG